MYNSNYVSYVGGQNQIVKSYADSSLIIVLIVLIIITILTTSKRKNDGKFFSMDTSNLLRGLGLVFLLAGHFATFCVQGKSFFELGGKWAVIVFLYISGISLTKTYGLVNLKSVFILNRIKRLALPTWITLILFYILDYYFLRNSYSYKTIILNFLGIITDDPPNGPAWFISYIAFLYLTYFLTSKLKLSAFFKVLSIYTMSYLGALLIINNKYLFSNLRIWIQYSAVFPTAVFIGLYRDGIRRILGVNRPIWCLAFSIIFILLFCFETEFDWFSHRFDKYVLTIIIGTFSPIPLIIGLLFATFYFDQVCFTSKFLNWIGKYSFEIYIVHMPFMVYYNFFLFREPLYFYIFTYLSFVIALGYALRIVSDWGSRLLFEKGLCYFNRLSIQFKKLLN